MTQASHALRQVLADAIYAEQSAHRLYRALADAISNAEGKRTFITLAKDEKGHRVKLEGWWKDRFGSDFEFDEANVDVCAVAVENQSGAVDALDLALDAEKRAATNYEQLAANSSDPHLTGLCRELAAQEWGHFEIIQAEKQAVTEAFHWFDIDFAGHVED